MCRVASDRRKVILATLPFGSASLVLQATRSVPSLTLICFHCRSLVLVVAADNVCAESWSGVVRAEMLHLHAGHRMVVGNFECAGFANKQHSHTQPRLRFKFGRGQQLQQ